MSVTPPPAGTTVSVPWSVVPGTPVASDGRAVVLADPTVATIVDDDEAAGRLLVVRFADGTEATAKFRLR